MNGKIFLLLFFYFMVDVSAQGKVEQSKKELNQQQEVDRLRSAAQTAQAGQPSARFDSADDDKNPVAVLILKIVFGVAYYSLIGDYKHEEHLYSTLTPYPYHDGKSGNYSDSLRNQFGRLDISNSIMTDFGSVQANHLKIKERPFRYFFVQGDWRQLREARSGIPDDGLALFHLQLCYDRIRFSRFNLGWHIGASYVASGVNKAGFSYGLSADYFLKRNLSFGASATWSEINAQPVNTYELYGRYHIGRYFFAAGYERMKIATPVYGFFGIGAGVSF